MSVFNQSKIRRLDLTVLLVFLALLRTGKAADVAQEMGLTNSSISHTLRRLREVFGDELFLRKPHGLEPTAFAIQIEPDIRKAVDAIQSALAGPNHFRPSTAEATIRISASDREIATHLAGIFAATMNEAPGIRFSVRSLTRSESVRELANGKLDFALGYFKRPSDDFEIHSLRKEGYLVVAREGHDFFKSPVTLEKYTQAQHVLVSPDGLFRGILDQILELNGLARNVAVVVPSFLAALSILSESEFIGTMPEHIVRHHSQYFKLSYCQPPINIRALDISIITHKRNQKNPAHQWFREKILSKELY